MKTPSSSAPNGPAVWDAHATVYEQIWERSTTLWGRDALVLGQLPPTNVFPPPRFLDVACGTGAFAIAAASLGFDVTATDFSAGMIARLHKKMASSSSELKISTQLGDGQTLEGFDDTSFDVVSSVFGAFMFPDRAIAWQSAWRVLKPGGRLLVTSWDAQTFNFRLIRYVMMNAAETPNGATAPKLQHAAVANTNRTLAAATFREELEECGFQDVQIHTTSHPMCFQTGEEYVLAIVDNSGFMSMASHMGKKYSSTRPSHKDLTSLKRCILEFAQCLLDGIDPFGEEAKVARGGVDATAENHPLWTKSFALQAVGHIAVAAKPLE